MRILRRRLWLVLILLLAFGLRVVALTEIPPGLTHDEANHGREAIGILDGVLRYYFPLNYGSEPLYSYTAAGLMGLVGEHLLALRLVNVLAALPMVAGAFVWTGRVFGWRVGMLTAVLLAISFWPLASSREALRVGLLPLFMLGAVWFFWRLVEEGRAERPWTWRLVVGFALSVTLTLHIYLAARVAWLLFPLFLLYLALLHRPVFRRVWRPALAGLLLAGALVTPMFLYLRQNPAAQTRLSMLDGPVQQIVSGEWLPILQNGARALLALVWPGFGDAFLAYNIPGRPTLGAATAVFFLIGVLAAMWRWRRPSYAFLLLWLGVGLIPSLVTGPTANTTRNMAAQTAVYILPALGFVTLADGLVKRRGEGVRPWLVGGAALWLLLTGWGAAHDYFVTWGQAPDVRGAYQTTLRAMLDYAEKHELTSAPTVISTVYPGPAHDPSIALVLSPEGVGARRWVDARYALALPPGAETAALIPASTPPHPLFTNWLTPLASVSLRPDDLDPSFTHYRLDGAAVREMVEGGTAVDFNGGLELLHADWLSESGRPGETAEYLTVWRVLDPTRVGPIVYGIDTTDVVMFTQVLHEGQVLAQKDALDAPSWSWQAGDLILQIHPVWIPAETLPGEYRTIVGVYDRASGARLPAWDEAGRAVGDFAAGEPLRVASGN